MPVVHDSSAAVVHLLAALDTPVLSGILTLIPDRFSGVRSVPVGIVTYSLRQSAVRKKRRPLLDRQGPDGRTFRCGEVCPVALGRAFAHGVGRGRDYGAKVNLITKVLDFVQLGGPVCTVGGTVFEMWLGSL